MMKPNPHKQDPYDYHDRNKHRWKDAADFIRDRTKNKSANPISDRLSAIEKQLKGDKHAS